MRSAHNLHVWRGGDYLGRGPAEHGRPVLDGVLTATVAHRGIADYIGGVATDARWSEREAQSDRDAAEEKVLLGLRTVEGVGLSDLTVLGRTVEEEPLAGLTGDGFLTVAAGRVRATSASRPVLDGVLRALLA